MKKKDTLLFFFDSAFNGTHIIDTLWDLSRHLTEYTTVFVIVPFAADKAIKAIGKQCFPPNLMTVNLVTGSTPLLTAKDCLPIIDFLSMRELVDVSPNVIQSLALSYTNGKTQQMHSLLSVDWSQGIAV